MKKNKLILSVSLPVLLSVFYVPIKEVNIINASSLKKPVKTISQSLIDIQKRLTNLEEKLDNEKNRLNLLEELVNDLENKQVNTADIKPEVKKSVIEVSDLGDAYKQIQESAEYKKYDKIDQISRFKKAGFSDDDALWLVDKVEDIRIDELYNAWEGLRQRYLEQSTESITTPMTAREQIKERLEPEEFEKYLKANGYPGIHVFGVVDNSPVALAGLLPDDEIISYNGERIYHYSELNDATVRGELGEPVTLGIIRNGEELKLNMERGPLGFTTKPDLVVFTPADKVE